MNADNATNPFVGLRPFGSEETLLFFGRQQQSLELLKRLHQYNFVGVTGTSGSGKSSLIRAGVIPRLKAGYLVNDRDHWIICMIKPGQSPLCNLAEELLNQLPPSEYQLTTTQLEQQIKEGGIEALLKLLTPAFNSNCNLFLLVDQFEEIFRFSLNQQDYEKKDEAIEFVNLLLELSQRKELPVYITITMRSDFIGDCSQIYGLPEALNESQYLVPRLTRQQLKTAIEGPIRLFKGSIDNGLTTRLLNDVSIVNDELPLLQHALMRVWELEQNGSKGALTIKDYETIGGLHQALSNHADQALSGLSENELNLTKKIFQALTAIDEKGRKIRRPAKLSELVNISGSNSGTLIALIDRFISGNRNFVVKYTSSDTDDVYIDISHESLIRQWAILNTWVDEEAEAAAIYARLIESSTLHAEKKKDLLVGNELHQMLEWHRTFKPSDAWATRYSANFKDHITYLQKSELAEKQERSRKRRNRRIIYGAVLFVFLLVSAFALYINKTNNHNKFQLALNYWTSSQAARTNGNYLETLQLISEAAVLTDNTDLNRDLLIDAYAFIPVAELKGITNLKTIINHLSFSHDDIFFVAAGNDGVAQIINRKTGAPGKTKFRIDLPLMSAIMTRDGKFLLTAGNDQAARIWNVDNGTEVINFAHEEAVTSAVFNLNETRILTACANGNVNEWERSTGKLIATFQHQAPITGAAYSHSGELIVTTSLDYTTTIWNTANKNKIHVFDHNKEVTAAVFSPNDSLLVTSSRDSTARVWDVNSKQELVSFKHNDVVTSVAFHPNGKWIVTGCGDKTATIWDINTGKKAGAPMLHNGRVYSVAFSNDGQWLVTGGKDEQVRTWHIAGMQQDLPVVLKHENFVTSASFSSNGKTVLTTTNDSTAHLWDVLSGRRLFNLQHNGMVTSGALSSDGTMVITSSKDSTAIIWNTVTGEALVKLNHTSAVNCAAISGDNQLVFTTNADKNLTLWDAVKGTVFKQVPSTIQFKKAVFSPDGNRILLTGKDSSAYLFDTELNIVPGRLSHENLITNAAFNVDGTRIITTGEDMTARIWDAVSLAQIGANPQHANAVNSAAFNVKQSWIVTGGWDRAVHLWSLLNMRELGLPLFHNGAVTSVSFSPDQNKIISSGYDSVALIHNIPGDLDMPPALFKLQVMAITGATYNASRGSTECLSAKEWKKAYKNYQEQGKEHAANCGFIQYNLEARRTAGLQ